MKYNVNINMFKIILYIYLGLLLLASCDNGSEITLGEDFVNNTTKIVQIDSFQVEMSTLLLDSIITSESDIVLVGNYKDSEFGEITSKSFFEVGLPNDIYYLDILEDDRYDSITISMAYSTYSHGDTNIYNEIMVYELNEKMIRTDDGYYYNSSDVEIKSIPLGSFKYLPRPSQDSIIEFRIDDELGLDLFEKLRSEAEEVSSGDEFEKYLYGLAIIPNTSSSSSIIGFYNSNVNLNIYTSRISDEVDEESEQIVYRFPSSGDQFNQISSNRQETSLDNLTILNNEVSADSIQNKAYIQAGIGILTKISFPSLNYLLFDENKLIISAELVLRPDIKSYENDFPESLYIYETDKYNNFNSYSSNDILNSSLFNVDMMYHENTYYSFDILSFIKEQIENEVFNNPSSLIISIPTSDFSSTINSVIFSASDNTELKPKLIINYLEI